MVESAHSPNDDYCSQAAVRAVVERHAAETFCCKDSSDHNVQTVLVNDPGGGTEAGHRATSLRGARRRSSVAMHSAFSVSYGCNRGLRPRRKAPFGATPYIHNDIFWLYFAQ